MSEKMGQFWQNQTHLYTNHIKKVLADRREKIIKAERVLFFHVMTVKYSDSGLSRPLKRSLVKATGQIG